MSQKGFGKTVLGWFVVDENGDKNSAPDTDALIAKYAGQEVQAPPVELKGPLPQVVDGTIDFQQVFAAAGVDEEERGRVLKAQELLRSLPAETPAPVKKQIVEASLKAFGVQTTAIIEAAVGEIEALEAFIRGGQAETQKILSEGTTRVAELEKEIAEVKKVMQQAVQDQEVRTNKANTEKLSVQQVLEFFGEDAVAKVVNDSPKLHQPS
jgi:hypothetical protein